MRTLKLRAMYLWRRILYLFGYCICGSRLKYTRSGQGVCPGCGRRI